MHHFLIKNFVKLLMIYFMNVTTAFAENFGEELKK